ncbi:SdrD B-like domain-containing protein [Amnibacterium endophyticum]|uniref:SdrD B-like domain-containing protein n=1 Tax=Amnibacterium endophyticum TaxID=2109337 RepID=A0ABW4LA21_9MICO
MARARRRHGRWFDLLATVLIGLVVTGAALIPAATANSGEQTTIRGDVSIGDQRLAFFPVGFWVPGSGAIQRGQTDANGVFTLEIPTSRDGYVYAGTEPDAERAVIEADGRQVVRGTIGAKVQRPIASPLYQGWDAATARNLAGGADRLHFRLQQAGRIGGTLPVAASKVRAVQVRRLDGSVVQTPKPDGRGRWRSEPLAPGRYAVALVPVAPLLPVSVQVDVVAEQTVRADPPAPVTGATVVGTVDATQGASVQAVPVLLERSGEVVASTTTSATGGYRFTGLAAGEYTVEIGRYPAAKVSTPSPSAVPAPLATPTATPAPTASATPTPTPDPSAQVLEPAQRVSELVQPVETTVQVPETLGEVAVRSSAIPAGRLAGVVSGADGAPVQVVVEETGTGRVLRVAEAGTDGRWSAGGLAPGERYTVWAVTRPADATQARMGTTDGLATTSTTGVDVTIDRPAASLRGTVVGATGGSVAVGDPALLARSSTIDASGAYAVQGLVPGLLPVVTRARDLLPADPVAVQVVEDGAPQDLQPGPRPATYRGWFISGGDGVSIVSGTASSPEGAVVRFSSRAEDGRLQVGGLRPGVYTYDADSFEGTVPAIDGPWWFAAPTGSFTLNAGSTTNAGPVVLHVRAR